MKNCPIWVILGCPNFSFVFLYDNQKQTILGNGINFEGTSGGTEVLSSKFESMLATLPTELARISLPLKIWEPVNDNSDPATFNLNDFQDTQGAYYTFLRMQELKKRVMKLVTRKIIACGSRWETKTEATYMRCLLRDCLI